MQFMAGFITAAALAGFIWGYRAWLTSQANKAIAQAEQAVKDTAAKVTAKL